MPRRAFQAPRSRHAGQASVPLGQAVDGARGVLLVCLEAGRRTGLMVRMLHWDVAQETVRPVQAEGDRPNLGASGTPQSISIGLRSPPRTILAIDTPRPVFNNCFNIPSQLAEVLYGGLRRAGGGK